MYLGVQIYFRKMPSSSRFWALVVRVCITRQTLRAVADSLTSNITPGSAFSAA